MNSLFCSCSLLGLLFFHTAVISVVCTPTLTMCTRHANIWMMPGHKQNLTKRRNEKYWVTFSSLLFFLLIVTCCVQRLCLGSVHPANKAINGTRCFFVEEWGCHKLPRWHFGRRIPLIYRQWPRCRSSCSTGLVPTDSSLRGNDFFCFKTYWPVLFMFSLFFFDSHQHWMTMTNEAGFCYVKPVATWKHTLQMLCLIKSWTSAVIQWQTKQPRLTWAGVTSPQSPASLLPASARVSVILLIGLQRPHALHQLESGAYFTLTRWTGQYCQGWEAFHSYPFLFWSQNKRCRDLIQYVFLIYFIFF